MLPALQRVKVPQRSLRALNDGVGEDQREELGITEGREGPTRSSFAFDHVTADFGVGASVPTDEIRHLAAAVRDLLFRWKWK